MTTIRDEAGIRADIEAARAAAQALTDDDSVKAHREAGEAVRALQQELADFLSAGAVPCAKCGSPPHGMLKRPEIAEARNELGEVRTSYAPAVYAVGCTVCGFLSPALAPSAEAAVEKWNRAHA